MDEAIRYPVASDRPGTPEPVILAGPTCDSADVLYERSDYRLPPTWRSATASASAAPAPTPPPTPASASTASRRWPSTASSRTPHPTPPCPPPPPSSACHAGRPEHPAAGPLVKPSGRESRRAERPCRLPTTLSPLGATMLHS
jgi:hypothetical protein